MAKRKKDDEYRTFQNEWTEEFAFVERAGSAVCHFDTRHATFASKYPAGDSRKKAAKSYLARCKLASSNSAYGPGKEALCAQMCDGQFGEVMSLVIRVINFIVARALNDRQFKTLLDEVGNNHPGLLLHSNVRWLSRGKVLSRFAACLNEIRTFLEMKGIEHPELAETEWLLKFYYLVDMTEHLNQLNVKMQGIGNTVDFEAEVADLKASDMWVNKFKSLNEDLERITQQKAELASKHMWTEMKKLQPEDQLILKTWNVLPVTYHTLQRVSIAVLTMFGSTYACEQSFSHLKNIKSNLRSRLTDESLNACMKLNLTKYQPDYKDISKSMQHQKSH
ncbi:hypothetical protein ACEWY4_010124 [Coilia grayii]|uniref:HAT C-terminal dimerisation domain-containing protein n=1 Tax=Coilia grayii TaxID=363190 RepID=A0ABD1K8F0_9TELE